MTSRHTGRSVTKNASIDNRLKLQDLRVNNWSPKPNFFCAVGWLMRNFGGYFFRRRRLNKKFGGEGGGRIFKPNQA